MNKQYFGDHILRIMVGLIPIVVIMLVCGISYLLYELARQYWWSLPLIILGTVFSWFVGRFVERYL